MRDDPSHDAILRLHKRLIQLSDDNAMDWVRDREQYGSRQYRTMFRWRGSHGEVNVTDKSTKILDQNGTILRSQEYDYTVPLFRAADARHRRQVSSVITAILSDLGETP